MNIIGYTYEADYHCIDCTEKEFGKDDLGYAFTVDNEDNPIHPVFSTDEIQEYSACAECSVLIGEQVMSNENKSIKAVSTDKFWEVLIGDSEPELVIGNTSIYKINKNYVLFNMRDNGYKPITETVEDEFGIHGGTQPTLQDAVDVALLHEFEN
tara:strand:+ start:2510 stop:2971 length:462 start_codon:yes stop_codon:yes gene_type:complete